MNSNWGVIIDRAPPSPGVMYIVRSPPPSLLIYKLTYQLPRMNDSDRNTIHGTVELRSGNREDLFSSDVIDILVNIICAGNLSLHVNRLRLVFTHFIFV